MGLGSKYTAGTVLGAIVAVQAISYAVVHSGAPIFFNDRFAFSLPVPVALMYAIYFVLIGVILLYLYNNFHRQALLERVAWGLILVGSLSNIGERLILGYVRDYIFILSGVFNAADFAIIFGILLLLYRSAAPSAK